MYVKKLLAALFVAVLLLSLVVLPSAAESPRVIDNIGLFTDSQLAKLDSAIAEAESASGASFYIITSTSHYGSKPEVLRACGASDGEDACILVIIKLSPVDTARYYDFYTNGMPDRRISDGEVNDILDDEAVYKDLKFGDPAAGALRFLEITPATMKIPYAVIITVAVIVALIVAGITVGTVVSKYKMKLRPTNYPLEQFAKLELTHNEDHFIGKHVSVVVTSSGSSGGGGRSGGGGGGARGGR